MKIKEITLKNFKKFENLTIALQSLDCLVGGNNSGKSSLLQSLALFDFCLHQCLTKPNGKPIALKNRTVAWQDFSVLPVVRNLLLTLKERGDETLLIELLKRCFPTIEQLNIAFDEANQQHIEVSYKEDNSKKTFDLFLAGSGFQQFIYLFGFILLEQPQVILLDEPDKHLHGHLQKAFYAELERLAEAGKQIIFATHSRDLISCVEPENIIHFYSGKAERGIGNFS